MRVVIQRVTRASVTIKRETIASIGYGMVVLLGIEETDAMDDVEWLCGKIARLRVFPDTKGVMNCSVAEVNGEMLVVSQFTLHASTKRGNRPSYIRAARPEQAIPLYESMIAELSNALGKPVATGVFGADMKVSLLNDGPVTIWMDSRNKE